MIHIEGLTQGQKLLCELLWECESQEDVDQMISMMPKAIAREARAMQEMITWAHIDEIVAEMPHSLIAQNVQEFFTKNG